MPYVRVPCRMKTALLSVCIAIAGTFSAAALDYNDVKNLMANQVSESVIINLVQQSPMMALTPGQVTELRGLGASETLISAIFTAPAASTATYVDPNTVYYDSSAPVVVEPAPTVVYQTPTYVYPPPPVYYYHPGRPTFGFSIGIGGGGRRHHRHYGGYRRWRHW